MADPENNQKDQNAIPPETDWPKPNIWPPRQWPLGSKQFISNFGIVIGVLIGFIVIIGCIFLLYDIIRTYFDTNNEKQFANLRNSLFILAALIGAPFLVWRTMIASSDSITARKQANIAQEKFLDDRFTKAREQLASVIKSGDETVPNIELRIGALYDLERIMLDNDKYAPAIIDTLANYVNRNCGKPKLFTKEITYEKITELQERAPANRYDIQTALKIIGRRPEKYKTKETMPDLTEVNLQGANLDSIDLSLCNFANARLTGSNLQGAKLQSADMRGADLEGADLQRAHLQWADLWMANLRGADLRGADLLGADLWRAWLQNTNLRDVKITEALTTATSVLYVNFTEAEYDFDTLQEQLLDMFGHKTLTTLPEGMKVPYHWSEVDMDAAGGHEQYEREWKAFKKEKGVG